ncbi:MAG TPA: hypothetical protein VHO50_08400 [Bacteroidales bacterium]|nr:hypothetical protein [Bacteroidales bacterium]
MKSLIPVVAMALIAGMMSCSGNKKHAGVEYYRNLQFSETPYDIEKGTHKLTEAEAKSINSYKFTYDEDGKLLSVEYVRDTVLLGYSSMGVPKIAYEYNGNMQTKYFYNLNGEKVDQGGVFAWEYALNNEGERVEMMYYNKEGAMIDNRNNIHHWVWSKLPDGMIKENRYNLKGEEVVMNPFCPFYELRFTYNDKGYVTRMANFMGDTLYNCTAENCGDIGVSYFSFTPNEAGDVERFEVFNVTGQMSNLYWGWSKRISKFDENGYVLETTYYDQDNEIVGGNMVPTTRYKYDEHGAVIETTNHDKDGNLMNNPSNGAAITRYNYDEAGRRIETLSFNSDNVAINTSSR